MYIIVTHVGHTHKTKDSNSTGPGVNIQCVRMMGLLVGWFLQGEGGHIFILRRCQHALYNVIYKIYVLYYILYVYKMYILCTHIWYTSIDLL